MTQRIHARTRKTGSPSKLGANQGLSMEQLESRIVLDAQLGLEISPADRLTISQVTSAEALKTTLVEQSVANWQHSFGQPTWGEPCWGGPIFLDAPFMRTDAAEGAADVDHSDTNVQVAGVDEGDIIETDGDYLYVLSNNELVVIDVRTPDDPGVVSRVPWNDTNWPSSMFLNGDRLTVLSSSYGYFGGPWIEPAIDVAVDVALPRGGIPCQEYHPHVTATVFDVSDRSDPDVIQSNELDGSLVDSRAIGDDVYLVLSSGVQIPAPEPIPIDESETGEEVESSQETDPEVQSRPVAIWAGEDYHPDHVYETEQQYRDRLATLSLDEWLPSYSSTNGDETVTTSGLLSEPTDIFYRPDQLTNNLLLVAVIDMGADTPGPADSASLLTNAGYQVYMSTENLYVFNPLWSRSSEATSIVKFDLDDGEGNVTVDAIGEVKGRMLNRFSADEHDGHLRVATTSGWGRESVNQVYVLGQTDDRLEIVGHLEEPIAPGENIYSVRFMGDRGYVVTFLRVDPLFSLDLSDPANPAVNGELKIPGFSDYLQPIDENYLLGIGRDADEETGRVDSMQISLFDVTDPNNPEQVDRYSFPGGRSTWSEAINDPHAVSYFAEYETLAIPAQTWGFGWREELQEEPIPEEEPKPDEERPVIQRRHSSGLFVFNIDVDEGFGLEGIVEHPTNVRRSVRVGEDIFSISWDTLKVNELADPSNELATLVFTEAKIVDRPTDTDGEIRTGVDPEDHVEQFDADGLPIGDANRDGVFDQHDIIQILQRGKYLAEEEADVGDGDFNGDGFFDQGDIVTVLRAGTYMSKPAAEPTEPVDEVFAEVGG